MAKRVKSDKQSLVQIRDWGHADKLVREIGDCQGAIQKAEEDARKKIESIKAELAVKARPVQDMMTRRIRSLEAFAITHKNDFEKQKSKQLNFGLLGWRKSTAIRIKKVTLEKIRQVFSRVKAATFIRTKESIDKEALAKLTDEQLTSVGARRESKDVFFVEPDLTQAAEYE